MGSDCHYLSLASMARLRNEEHFVGLLRRQREFFYGKTWDQVTGSFKAMQGASDGAIDQWINILDEVAKSSDLPGLYQPSLKKFLTSPGIKWGRYLQHGRRHATYRQTSNARAMWK